MNDFPKFPDDDYRRRNFEICNSIDITKLGCTLDGMVKDGSISQVESEFFLKNADSLRQLLRIRNEKFFLK